MSEADVFDAALRDWRVMFAPYEPSMPFGLDIMDMVKSEIKLLQSLNTPPNMHHDITATLDLSSVCVKFILRHE
jgi:hypothetical protein